MNEWTEFEEEVEVAAARHKGGPGCGVKRMLDTLDDDARRAIAKTLARRELSAASIASVLKRRLDVAVVPSWWTISSHRRGGCACPRKDES